ncbi:fungal-specific transcription factor domain-containing protein [Xylogone sp. PMI_703]|nr:fungal-specific transcription factor domain-containing protein [Xylogone sp. PMI_703]
MSRPQVGIERLPARRMSNEPRESMNCKSCRKRKIKCNRLRPACEACQVFQCPCIYDAIPKKRGPKTDVLEALLKRVDGLERRLKDEKKGQSPNNESAQDTAESSSNNGESKPQLSQKDPSNSKVEENVLFSPTSISVSSPSVRPSDLLDTYFARCHGKAYYILDETSARQRIQLNQMPNFLLFAIYAVSARYTPHPKGYHAAVRLSEDYATRARSELDIDDPTIDALEALLLLAISSTASGKGKKAYMLLSAAIAMAMALELHREAPQKARISPIEREMRRRIFWTCYVMDKFMACGSKRPSLIADKSIVLRLPSWSPSPAVLPVDGEFFQSGSNLQYHSGTGKKCQGSSGMLIDIARILGITNRYLAAGGVKGDSHFPWHSLSNLSKIRQDLDIWASGTQDVFTSVETLFGQPDSTTLVLSKLIYHLIHCLIYRPFLPIDLAELAGTGQHQSWQIEATNLCFLHANAIAELVELGKQSSVIEWPAFVGYCICTAGTVHVHGAHYKSRREGEVFSASAEFLSREMQQLSELRYAWSSVQHQRETLQTVYGCHSELVKSLATSPMRYSPVFHLEDFFDRYNTLGQAFDGAHISFSDIMQDPAQDIYQGHDLYAPRTMGSGMPDVAKSKRRASMSRRKMESNLSMGVGQHEPPLISPNGTIQKPEQHPNDINHNLAPQSSMLDPSSGMSTFSASGHGMPNLSNTPFSPPYAFSSVNLNNHPESYDPMFSMPQMTGGNGFGYGDVTQQTVMTPGGRSNGESTGTNPEEKDPFLSLLEQLAENEHSRGGPSELDFFLSGGST